MDISKGLFEGVMRYLILLDARAVRNHLRNRTWRLDRTLFSAGSEYELCKSKYSLCYLIRAVFSKEQRECQTQLTQLAVFGKTASPEEGVLDANGMCSAVLRTPPRFMLS